MLDVISKRKYYLGFSVLVMVLSWFFVIVWGLQPGIDLNGGTEWQVALGNGGVSESAVQEILNNVPSGAGDANIKLAADGVFSIRLPNLTNEQHQVYADADRKSVV